MRLRDRPIKQKLMFVTLMTSSLALLLMCVSLVTYEVITYRSEVVSSTRALARVTAANSTAALAFENVDDARETLTALAAEPEILAAAVYNKSGELFASYIRPDSGAEIPASASGDLAQFTGSQLHVFQPVEQAGKFQGTLFLSSELWPVYRRLLFYGILVIGVGGAATVAALGLSTLLQRRISAPIAELVGVSRVVSETENYSVRASKHGSDELGQLTDAFNQMLARIGESRAQLEEGEERLRIAKEAAEAANAAKDSFLAILSHELRTPLTPVLATVALMEEDPGLPEKAREDLRTIRRNVEVEARLIDDLLDVTRIARGKLELQRKVVDAGALLEHALENYCAPEAARKCLKVTKHNQASELFVSADPSRLTQVFWNILQNACKFTAESGTIAIRVSNEPREGEASPWLIISIEDSGIGIDPEVLPRIFDAFEQGERARTRLFGGLGLGLAISRAIVELHGGSLTAASKGPGTGATFTIRLATVPIPANAPSETQDAPPRSAPPVPAPAPISAPASTPDATDGSRPKHSPLRILLVEDHADTATQLSRLLNHLGHEVTIASTIADARVAAERLAARSAIDLVLSDLGLPDGNGQDLMRELSQRFNLHGIALSGYGMEEDVRASLEAGFECHLTKPVNWEALREIIGKFAARANGDAARSAPAPR